MSGTWLLNPAKGRFKYVYSLKNPSLAPLHHDALHDDDDDIEASPRVLYPLARPLYTDNRAGLSEQPRPSEFLSPLSHHATHEPSAASWQWACSSHRGQLWLAAGLC